MQIWSTNPHQQYANQAPGDYFDERDQNTVFEEVAAYNPDARGIWRSRDNRPFNHKDTPVTANFFSFSGLNPTGTNVYRRRGEPVRAGGGDQQ